MSKKSLTANVKNLCRGKQSLRHLRLRLFTALYTGKAERLGNVGDYLLQSLLILKESDSNVSFAILEKDFENLERLIDSPSSVLEENLLNLSVEYILKNKDYVTRMQAAEGAIATKLIDQDIKARGTAFQKLDVRDRQSLIAFKLYASLHSSNQNVITKYFKENAHSSWVKKRLIYPIMFLCMTFALPEQMNDYLESSFSNHKYAKTEQNVIRYLLFGDSECVLSLSFKAYLTFLMHPYDAYETILNHFESTVASGKRVEPEIIDYLERLNNELPSVRLGSLLKILNGEEFDVDFSNATTLPILNELSLSDTVGNYLTQYLSRPDEADDVPPKDYPLLLNLDRIRNSEYPEVSDFNEIALFARKFKFLEFGRLVHLFITGQYLIDRESSAKEKNDLLWQLAFFGKVNEFIMTSPRYSEAKITNLFLQKEEMQPTLRFDRKNRWWIKDFHYSQFKYERALDFQNWFMSCRKAFPLFCNTKYLSGIDWEWVAKITQVARIKPFIGNEDAIYVLLLQQIERSLPDSTTMKLAFSPYVDSGNQTTDFVTTLEGLYGKDALAFVNTFLTPTMILSLGLETSYTAALSARVEGLELLIDKFGYNNEVITSEQFNRELRSLVTYLVYSVVGEEQFEIPWSTFRDAAETNAEDYYQSYILFHQNLELKKLLGKGKIEKAKVYANKRVVTYGCPNDLWPAVDVVTALIDVFLSHPSYGIESILAVSIRHDNLRTEFSTAIEDAEKVNVAGITLPKFQSISAKFRKGIFDVLQDWVDDYMHTPRGSKKGIFEFVPSQKEIVLLVDALNKSDDLAGFTVTLSEWLKVRLQQNLESSRTLIEKNLREDIRSNIKTTRAKLKSQTHANKANIDKVADVLSTVIESKCVEIMRWFKAPEQERSREITFSQMRFAVERRFYRDLESEAIKLSFYEKTLGDQVITKEHIKCTFNIWSELVLNAKKYSNTAPVRVRIKEVSDESYKGFLFSSLMERSDSEYHNSFKGSPVSADGEMLVKGKSGLKKVAFLAATLIERDCELQVYKKKRSFHVFVPHETIGL